MSVRVTFLMLPKGRSSKSLEGDFAVISHSEIRPVKYGDRKAYQYACIERIDIMKMMLVNTDDAHHPNG